MESIARTETATYGAHRTARLSRTYGFTLIELLIGLAILGILARIAIPAYSSYLLRGQLVNATNGLSAEAAQMEQYFQDNRTYASVSASVAPPCLTASIVGQFQVSCVAPGGSLPSGTPTAGVGASTYTLIAVGGYNSAGTYTSSLPTAGFYYTLDSTGVKFSAANATWSSATCPVASGGGWMLRPGQCS